MTGEALDHKTPLLRSQQVITDNAEPVLKLFGHDPARVVSFCGAEQEFFLIDRNFFLARPNLLNSGRTLFGIKPPRGQEFDDHFFGAIPERVLGFMMDTERELFKLGIPARTRHNAVAPGQFETAPVLERANVAADRQQPLMTTFKTHRPSATNDHRLDANEAPPAIISIFLGDQLAGVFEQIAKAPAISSKGKGSMMIGLDTLPILPTDQGDRNRTSPFAFTGNRFEFRAPGSLQSVGDGVDFDTAVQELLEGRRGRRPVDATDLPGDAVHPVVFGSAEAEQEVPPEVRPAHVR